VPLQDIARLIRAEVHALKERPFILKARAAGLRTLRILGKHLIPNVIITTIAIAVIRIADIILIETALSYIGLGVQPPTASWGSVINDGRLVLSSAWWVTLFPGMAIILTTMSLYVIGDGIKALRQ
jgi:peptide/nickel transport system permease protein